MSKGQWASPKSISRQLGVNVQNLDLSSKNKIGEGVFGNVYKFRDLSGNENPDYVMKEIKFNVFEKMFDKWGRSGKIPFQLSSVLDKRDMFRREVVTLGKLSDYNISPKVVYSIDEPKRYIYVMEKMDTTLGDLMRKREFTPEQAIKLVNLAYKYFDVPFYHTDLHPHNVMWSDKLGDFRLIDWGFYRTIKPGKEGDALRFEKIGEEFSISQGLIKIVWKYAGEMISKKSVGEDEKKKWKAIKRMILARMEEVFPDPAVKERYVKNLDKGYFREIFAKGPVEKRTRKRKGTHKKQKKRGKTRRRK